MESILAQTFTDFELLLVDDGSHDAPPRLRRAGTGGCPHPGVPPANGGPAHARNTGLDNARGDYIGMVDSDDLIEPTMFATLYSAVQVDGVRLAACAGDCIDADGKKIEAAWSRSVRAACAMRRSFCSSVPDRQLLRTFKLEQAVRRAIV